MIGIPNRRSHKPMCEIFQFTLPYNSPTGTAISFSETIPLIRRMIGKGNDLRQLKRRPPSSRRRRGLCPIRECASVAIRGNTVEKSHSERDNAAARTNSSLNVPVGAVSELHTFILLAPYTLHPVPGSNAIWESVPCKVHTHCAFLPFIFSLTGPTSYRNLVT